MNKLKEFFKGRTQCNSCGLLVLRVLPSYYMISNHGWSKITNPVKWEKLGDAFSKYFGGSADVTCQTPVFRYFKTKKNMGL